LSMEHNFVKTFSYNKSI